MKLPQSGVTSRHYAERVGELTLPALGQNFAHDLTMDIGKPERPAVVRVGQSLVIDSQ